MRFEPIACWRCSTPRGYLIRIARQWWGGQHGDGGTTQELWTCLACFMQELANQVGEP